MQTSKDADSQT